MRAIAVLAVVGYHAFPAYDPAGFIGVDIFFAISGYLISSIIFDRLDGNSFSFIDFYARRARRIFPALFAVLNVCLVAGWFLLLPQEFRELGTHVAAAAAFVSNFLLWHETGYFDSAAEAKPLLHLWSLGIEEQFYLLWPLLLALAWRAKKVMPRLMGVVAGLLAVASFAYCLYATFHAPAAGFYSPAARWWELMAGGLLAKLVMKRDLLSGLLATLASLAGAALLAATLLLLDPSQPFPGTWAPAPVLAACLLLFAGHGAWFNRVVLSNRLLVGIGLISYPLYLWHWPLLSFARIFHSAPLPVSTTLAILAASLALAWLTYLIVERPLRFGSRLRKAAPALVALLAVAGVTGVSVREADGFGSRTVIGQVRPAFVVDNPTIAHQPCPDLAAMPAILATACYDHINPRASHIVVVWGDSHALPWAVDFEDMAAKDDFQLYVLKLEGCPPLSGVRRTDIKASQAVCDTLAPSRALLDAIEALHPDVVVMTARWSNFSQGWMRNGRLMAGNSFLTTSPDGIATLATSRQALAERIPATIEELRAHRISVVVIRNPPVLKFEITNLRKSIAEIEVTPAENDALSRYTDEIFARTKGFELFDPAKLLCTTVCRAVIDGHELYVDDNHLGLFGARLFESQLDNLTRHVLAARGDVKAQ